MSIGKTLVQKINNSMWWHVPPKDPEAYKKRGKFFASTFLQASFYGRPNDEPSKVRIHNPVYGFSEEEILIKLFGRPEALSLLKSVTDDEKFYNARIILDAKIYQKARRLGHDAVVLIVPSGRVALQKNKKPNSIELNLLALTPIYPSGC